MEIPRYKFCVDKPEAIKTDSRGLRIDIGDKIAFNKSGCIKFGFIHKIVKNEWVIRNDQKDKAQDEMKAWILKIEKLISQGLKFETKKHKEDQMFIIIDFVWNNKEWQAAETTSLENYNKDFKELTIPEIINKYFHSVFEDIDEITYAFMKLDEEKQK